MLHPHLDRQSHRLATHWNNEIQPYHYWLESQLCDTRHRRPVPQRIGLQVEGHGQMLQRLHQRRHGICQVWQHCWIVKVCWDRQACAAIASRGGVWTKLRSASRDEREYLIFGDFRCVPTRAHVSRGVRAQCGQLSKYIRPFEFNADSVQSSISNLFTVFLKAYFCTGVMLGDVWPFENRRPPLRPPLRPPWRRS
jgi:hypothetical protein